MSFSTNYYCVSATVAPWTSQLPQTVGFYSSEQTARKVGDLIREINLSEFPGGIDVTLEEYQGVFTRSPAGLIIKDSGGAIIMITEKLDREEYQRLVNLKFYTAT